MAPGEPLSTVSLRNFFFWHSWLSCALSPVRSLRSVLPMAMAISLSVIPGLAITAAIMRWRVLMRASAC